MFRTSLSVFVLPIHSVLYAYWELSICLCFRNNENWSEFKNGPPTEREHYDGPPGMEVDGIIQSNWDEVNINYLSELYSLHDIAMFYTVVRCRPSSPSTT